MDALTPIDHQVDVAGGVATITLDRPQAYNALTGAMLASLRTTIAALEAERSVRALIVTGAGKGFCSGQALDDTATIPRGATWSIGATVVERYNPLILALLESRIPTIAAINGVVTGAGLGLALACDIRIAADDALFSTGFAKIGLAVDAGVSVLLPRVMGYGRALEFALTAARLDAAAALSAGLITRVVPRDGIMAAARDLAAALAAGPASLGLIKRGFVRNGLGDVVEALRREAVLQNVAGRTDDAREGITAFAEKRTATFTGS
jgi:2-(1,2-epoxy-1,2-dihydrophenyl)acetyl-CoA isomerase